MTAEITAVRFFVYRVSAGEEAEEEQDDRQTEKSCPCCNAEKLPINFLKGRISPIVPQILGRLHKKKTQQVNKKKSASIVIYTIPQFVHLRSSVGIFY